MTSSLRIPLIALALIFILGLLGSVWFGYSVLYPIILALACVSGYLLIFSPFSLLLVLVVVRMSLDYFGETISIPVTQTLAVTLSQLIGVGIGILGIAALFIYSQTRTGLRHTFPLGIVFFWGIASLFVTISPSDTLRELLRIFDIIALSAFAYASVRDIRDYRLLVGSVLLSSVIPVLTGIYQFINGIGVSDDAVSVPRIFGTFSHPNIFGLYLFIVTATVALAIVIQKHRRLLPTLGLLLAGITLAATLVITYARVAWISLALFLFLITVIRFRVLILPIIFIPLLLYIFLLPFQERVDSMFQSNPGSSIAWRQLLWTSTVQDTLSNGTILSGSGMSTFPIIAEQLHEPTIGHPDAHNDFVKFFVEGGVLGLFVYLVYLALLIWPLALQTWITRQQPESTEHLVFLTLFVFVIALTAASLSDNVFKNTPVQWILWILIGASFKIFPKLKRHPELIARNA